MASKFPRARQARPYNTTRAAARRQNELEEVRRFYERHPEMAPRGYSRGSMGNAEYHEALDAALTARIFGGTPQCVKLPDGSWAQTTWGNPRVTEADDADGGDEFAGWAPPTGYNTTGDMLADGQIAV